MVVGSVVLAILGVPTAFVASAMQEGALREFVKGIDDGDGGVVNPGPLTLRS
jgi:hypothetical protein